MPNLCLCLIDDTSEEEAAVLAAVIRDHYRLASAPCGRHDGMIFTSSVFEVVEALYGRGGRTRGGRVKTIDEMTELPSIYYFGEPWPCSVCDNPRSERVQTPTDRLCFSCDEPIEEDQQGTFMGNGIDPALGPYLVIHKECLLRDGAGGIGHLVDHVRYCHSELGTDAGLSRRASSLLVWDVIAKGRVVTEADLERARQFSRIEPV